MQDAAVALADPRWIHVGEKFRRLLRQGSEKGSGSLRIESELPDPRASGLAQLGMNRVQCHGSVQCGRRGTVQGRTAFPSNNLLPKFFAKRAKIVCKTIDSHRSLPLAAQGCCLA